jgi:isoleucyl-tRNA synthetase
MEPLDQYILARTAELDAKIREAYDDFEFHRAYHALNEFVNTDLSALYLDVLKDRLYTFAPNAPARRSAQTALWRIAEALTRLIAPILSFTADEVWGYLPEVTGREKSVHLALFPDLAEIVPGSEAALEKDWEQLLELRGQVLAKLELLRANKVIGKSLEAVVTLYVTEYGDGDLLRKYARALPELFNVSEVEFLTVTDNDPDYLPNMEVRRSTGPKCERCWRYVQEVGQDGRFPTVCLRCAEALEEIGFPPYEKGADA